MTVTAIKGGFSRLRYPKFLLLILTFMLAYLLLGNGDILQLNAILSSLGYFGTFLAGVFYAYGFTAAPATAFLLLLAKQQNIILAGLIGGAGALAGDILIFHFIKHSFADEIERLSKEKLTLYLGNKTPGIIKRYLLPVLSIFIIASPLPDEIGVSLLAVSGSIRARTFTVISYVLNTAGIFIILSIGSVI